MKLTSSRARNRTFLAVKLSLVPFGFLIFGVVQESLHGTLVGVFGAVLWHATFLAGSLYPKSLTPLLCLLVAWISPWYLCSTTITRMMYGMASLTHFFRICELQVLEDERLEKLGPAERIAIVHWYHDIRESKEVPEGKGLTTALWLGARLTVAILTAFAMRKVLLTYETYCDEVRTLVGGLLFLGGMFALDDGYRLALVILSYGYALPQSCMRDLDKATNLRKFWKFGWNRVIQVRFVTEQSEQEPEPSHWL